jgi:hypothetical protein
MSGDSLEMLRARGHTPPARGPGAVNPETDEDACPAFGFLRGLHDRTLSVEFRLADGNSEAFPYSWLGPIKYNPSAGLLLKFTGDLIYLVLIEGSNLNALVKGAISLYDRGLLRHRITWVREMSRQELQNAGEGEVTVERIRRLSHRPDDEPKGVAWLQPFQERWQPSS